MNKESFKAKIDSYKAKLEEMKAELEKMEAEPKVLTADEMLDNYGDFQCRTEFIEYGESMHQNGRLERDLELRPLVEYVNRLINDFLNYQTVTFRGRIADMRKIINGIPPLKP